MSTRSPTNKRNTEGDVTGVARKSASSAKPATPAASSVHVVATSGKEKSKQYEQGENLEGLSKEEKKERKRARRREEDRIYTASEALMKEDPEFNKYNRVSAIFMLGSVGLLIALWIFIVVADVSGVTISTTVRNALLIVPIAVILIGLIYDTVKVRPIRDRYQLMVQRMSDGKIDAIISKAAEKEEQEERAKEARKSEKKARKKAEKEEKRGKKAASDKVEEAGTDEKAGADEKSEEK